MKTKISISLCPTGLEYSNGDQYDAELLLAAIKKYALSIYPDAKFVCLQVGVPGATWASVDERTAEDELDRDKAGEDLLAGFFEEHGADEDLFLQQVEK
jgi:hypothetical protein